MIRAFDIAYFMISTDTLEDNTAFAKKENADFPLLADPTRETANKYGVLADYSRFKLGELPDALDVLHRGGRPDPRHRQEGQPGTSGEDIVAHLKTLKIPPSKTR